MAQPKGRPAILKHLAHRTILRFNRWILRPLLGRFVTRRSYEAIGRTFRPSNVTADDLSLAAAALTATLLDCATAILDCHGVVVLRDFLPSTLIEAACHEADLVVT